MAEPVESQVYPPKTRMSVPDGTVVLYQFGREDKLPSISPFPVKLETYLRMAKIPYKNDMNNVFSSKGKMPWISYNGIDVADSQFCIEYLNQELGVDLNKHLTSEQRAVAQAFRRMIEEGFYWVIIHQRWVRDGAAFDYVNKIGYGILRLTLQDQAQGQGTGRHSNKEADHQGERDIRALADFLGDKMFLMGDTPCEEDASIFAFLAFCQTILPGSSSEKLVNELANLSAYVERMKERFWPDWNDCLKIQ